MISKNFKRKKGFTLIELLIVLVLMLIVAQMVYTFFISNLNSINTTETKSDLQEAAQQAMYNITKAAVGCSSISNITSVGNSSNNLSQSSQGVSLSSITFINTNNTTNQAINTSTFQLNGNNLEYQYTDTETYPQKIISNYVNDIKVTPIPANVNYNQCNGISVTIDLQEQNQTYRLSSEIYFRNSNTN